MAANRSKLSPPLFHNFFSLGAGIIAVRLVHHHQVWLLVATQAIWVLSLVFVNVRAKRAGGVFLEADPVLYYGFSIPLYIVGLLFAACAYAVFG
jgi:hypothetical protein